MTAKTPSDDRDDAGRFAPGNKLSPGKPGPGRPAGQTITAELRRQADPERIAKYLLGVIDDPKASTKDRLRAAELVHDRLEGKATQHIDVTAQQAPPEHDLSKASVEQLERLRAIEDERDAILAALPAPVDG